MIAELFLDFVGLEIDFGLGAADPAAITRSENAAVRLRNINTHSHNFLRISRLVRCLGEVGLGEWQLPLLRQLAAEVFQTRALRSAADS